MIIIKGCKSIKNIKMGSSMSDPARFKQKNREKQFQAYQRKYPDGDIIPVKMRLKHVKSEGNIFNK